MIEAELTGNHTVVITADVEWAQDILLALSVFAKDHHGDADYPELDETAQLTVDELEMVVGRRNSNIHP